MLLQESGSYAGVVVKADVVIDVDIDISVAVTTVEGVDSELIPVNISIVELVIVLTVDVEEIEAELDNVPVIVPADVRTVVSAVVIASVV